MKVLLIAIFMFVSMCGTAWAKWDTYYTIEVDETTIYTFYSGHEEIQDTTKVALLVNGKPVLVYKGKVPAHSLQINLLLEEGDVVEWVKWITDAIASNPESDDQE